MSINLIGRDSRTLSKLFESITNYPNKFDVTLSKAKEIQAIPQKKFILGLRY